MHARMHADEMTQSNSLAMYVRWQMKPCEGFQVVVLQPAMSLTIVPSYETVASCRTICLPVAVTNNHNGLDIVKSPVSPHFSLLLSLELLHLMSKLSTIISAIVMPLPALLHICSCHPSPVFAQTITILDSPRDCGHCWGVDGTQRIHSKLRRDKYASVDMYICTHCPFKL